MFLQAQIMLMTMFNEVTSPTPITGEEAVSKLWKALLNAFGTIWTDIIGGQMPQVVSFFATYWIFLFGVIMSLFMIAFGLFGRLMPGR